MDFMNVAERLGIPLAVLAAFGVAVWRVLVYLGKKVVEPITEAHIELVKSTKETNNLNAETLKGIGVIIQAKTGVLDKIGEQNDKILDLAAKNHGLLIELKKQNSEA